jgi:hypothetical protein
MKATENDPTKKAEFKKAEFYEAMPATMEGMAIPRQESTRSHDKIKFLPLLILPVVTIIGLIAWMSHGKKPNADEQITPEQPS